MEFECVVDEYGQASRLCGLEVYFRSMHERSKSMGELGE